VDDGEVEMTGGVSSTTKACHGDVAELEEAMQAVLQPGTDIDLDGDQLVLRNGSTRVTLSGGG
jgi:heat shock protein HslJ